MNKLEKTYKTLHFLGLEIQNKQVTLKHKKEIIGIARFSEIDEIGLLKTELQDTSSFLYTLSHLIFRSFNNQSSTSPEQIYMLYINKRNGEKIQKQLKSFNLIGTTHELKALNEEIVAQRNNLEQNQ